MARREASSLTETHSKVVDREERRKERAAAVVSVNAFFGFVEMLTEGKEHHRYKHGFYSSAHQVPDLQNWVFRAGRYTLSLAGREG